MEILTSPAAFRAYQSAENLRSYTGYALVPTMGALHQGHLSLIEIAKEQTRDGAATGPVIVSLFVNPTQFDNADDLEKYPRRTDEDLAKLRNAGVDAVFMPAADVIYPAGSETQVVLPQLSGKLHGQTRPGHFQGVSSVVCRLLNIIQPQYAVFGEKDYQQLAIIRQMVRDLFIPTHICAGKTIRDHDGLALSSRNSRLSADERAAAPVLYQSLCAANALHQTQNVTIEMLRHCVNEAIENEPLARVARIDLVHPQSLEPLVGDAPEQVAILLSAYFGEILLIDQLLSKKETPS